MGNCYPRPSSFEPDVVLFPDLKLPCRDPGACPYGDKCRYDHSPTGLTRVLTALQSARRSIDCCVYSITSDELCGALWAAQKRGVRVRVITDAAQASGTNSDVGKLRASGIPVRDNTGDRGLMHHKLAVIDNELVLTGSFNWTTSAILYNRENLIIVKNKKLAESFGAEFEKLWLAFAGSEGRRATEALPVQAPTGRQIAAQA